MKMVRPTTIDGIQPHKLEIPGLEPATNSCRNSQRSTSEDSLDGVNGNSSEKADRSKDSEDEAGLSDEGLGDITSEASNSPQPPQGGIHKPCGQKDKENLE